MRDYRKLRAFEAADAFVLDVYRVTKWWPEEERYGLTAQVRRAAVSISSNIVEGCSRNSQREFLRFIEIAYGSAREVHYQLSLAARLTMHVDQLEKSADECCRILHGLFKNSE
jgi:four helix bundle protein